MLPQYQLRAYHQPRRHAVWNSDTQQPRVDGLYHLAEDASKEDIKTLADWQKGPNNKGNYEKRCQHIQQLFPLDKSELLRTRFNKLPFLQSWSATTKFSP